MKLISTKYYLALFLSSLLFMNFQCSDCVDELHDQTGFSAIMNSDQSIFSVGDTLVLRVGVSSQLELEFNEITHDNSNQRIDYQLGIFEGVNDASNVIKGREHFEYIDLVGNVTLPQSRTWGIRVENTCDDTLCELEFGMIPKKAGYFGFSLQPGGFGYDDECKFLTFYPTGIESSDGNNFEIFDEIGITRIRIDGSSIIEPESRSSLYFFEVVE